MLQRFVGRLREDEVDAAGLQRRHFLHVCDEHSATVRPEHVSGLEPVASGEALAEPTVGIVFVLALQDGRADVEAHRLDKGVDHEEEDLAGNGVVDNLLDNPEDRVDGLLDNLLWEYSIAVLYSIFR